MREVVLVEKVMAVIPNKYEAIRVAAKEARRINSLLIRGATIEVQEKPTMMAIGRLLENRVKYEYLDPEVHKKMFEEDE